MRFSTQIISLFSSLLFANWLNLVNGEDPFYREIVGDDETAIYAHIGPAGGDRGYYAITGQQPYNDLAWYLNGMLVPELVLRRDTTYYFYVNGGNSNPMYISDTNYGGYAQLSASDRLEQELFAGVTPTGWNSAGGVTSYEAPGWGPICYYEPTTATSNEAVSFLEYYETLDTSCASDTWLIGQAGVLEFTPDAWTPDTLYYQSVNFQNMGYKITVIDADAPAATSSPTASPTKSQTPWPTKAPTWAPVASPVDLGDFEEMALSGPLNGATLFYKFNEADTRANGEDTISIVLEVPSEAWAAWAISTNGNMVGSQAVLGFPDTGEVMKYDIDAKSPAGIVAMSDDKQTLLDTSITQEGGTTTLSFTKILSEDGEIEIKSDDDNIFLSAWGSSNSLGYHASRAAYTVTANVPDVTPTEAPVPAPTADEAEGDFEVMALTGGLTGSTLSYKINEEDSRANGEDTISIILEVPSEAWAAWAISEGGTMVGSEAVIGFPDSGEVLKYNLNAKSLTGVTPMPDDQQTLIDTNIEQANGVTTLSFTKILSESGEITIKSDEDNIFLSAYGSSNTLGIHSVRGAYAVSPVQEEEDDDEVPVFDDEDFEILALEGQLGGSDLRFKFNQNDVRANGKDTISVILQIPTEAWAAMAFSDNGGFMLGSEAVIGLPNTGEVLKYNLNAKSLSGVVPMPDDQQTLIDTSIEQIGGTTILSFTKILEEDGEITINLEEDNTFLTAWGSSNNLGIHSVRGSYSLEGKVLDTRKENLWKLHGWLASIAWTVLSPMAITSSILRRFIQGDGTWFQIHRTLNMMVVAFTIAAVITAYLAINQETPDGAKAQHFSSDVSGGHRTIGGVIFILALLQAIGGILRPHAPHKPEPENDEEAHQGDKLDAPEKTSVRFFWEVGHRTLGLGILCLCWYQVALGIETFSDIFNGGDEGAMLPAYYAVVGTFALIMVVGYVMKAMAPV